jgi:hypothetical protein
MKTTLMAIHINARQKDPQQTLLLLPHSLVIIIFLDKNIFTLLYDDRTNGRRN